MAPHRFLRTRLPQAFYRRDAQDVARDLLGAYLVRQTNGIARVGMIVETEAYLGPHDLAAHARHGVTKRNASLFGPIGHAYVYLIYGIHECMNVVTGAPGDGAAVLIRALEPVANCNGRTSGPGLLAKSLGITRAQDGWDLQRDDFFIAARDTVTKVSIKSSHRIGVAYAGHWARRKLRFYVAGNPHVSRLREDQERGAGIEKRGR